MSDWQVGDLAVCVDARPGCWCASNLVEGRAYTVTAVHESQVPVRSGIGPSTVGLLLAETAPADARDTAFNAERFRKIRPDEHEACEPEFVTLLKRTKVRA